MRRLAVVICLALVLNMLHPVGRAIAAVPSGFTDESVAAVGSPTALAFTPDGRLLVTTQNGTVRVVQNGALLATPALSIPATVLCSNSERGLLGLAVDPAFASNNFVYLFYTRKTGTTCPTSSAGTPVNRVSRFILGTNNVIQPASETVLIDNMPSYGGNHNSGDLQFGPDGYLYVTIGDGGCDYAGGGCAGNNDAARDPHVLVGKLLRITGDGNIPAGNPFQGPGTGRCNVTGSTTAGNQCRETFSSGLRNPFRMAVDPNSSTTRLFLNDVGQGAREEIDLAAPGADFGWNYREGTLCNNAARCNDPGLTDPIFEYGRSSGCASITGAAFVPNGAWGAAYDNTYMYADYVCGTIFTLRSNGSGGYVSEPFATGLGSSSAVAMRFGPHAAGQALYYTTYANGGEVRRVFPTAQAPSVTLTANTTSGDAPLAVTFTATPTPPGSYDYLWNFGDGITSITAAASTGHTYSADGRYEATVRVRAGDGRTSAPATLVVRVGNNAPQASVTAPRTFAVGATIAASATGTDPEDGALPESAFSWTALLHHNTHTHPLISPTTGRNLALPGPAPEDLGATVGSYVELRLTVTDSSGATSTVSKVVQPRRVKLTFTSTPTGARLVVAGRTIVAPATVTSWARWRIRIEAPARHGGLAFQHWSDGGSRWHTITTPAAPTTYSATYR